MVEEYSEREMEGWRQINLKTFFAILFLMNPKIKQADIAHELGITPVTLSRIINSSEGEGGIRPDWIPVLKPYLMSIDTKKFDAEWKRIFSLYERHIWRERHDAAYRVLSKQPWLAEWSLTEEQLDQPRGLYPSWSFVFSKGPSEVWYMTDMAQYTHSVDGEGRVLQQYRGFMSSGRTVRLSFLNYDQRTFDERVEVMNHYIVDKNGEKTMKDISVIWLDVEKEELISKIDY